MTRTWRTERRRFDNGSAPVRNSPDPGQPTVKEYQEHMTRHRPNRSCCEFPCDGMHGVNAPHRRSDGQDDLKGVPACVNGLWVSWREGIRGSVCSPVLVIRERRHKMTWAMLVPRKGTEFPFDRKASSEVHRSTRAHQSHAQVQQ